MKAQRQELTSDQIDGLIEILHVRFEKNMDRHPGLKWDKLKRKLESDPLKLWSLSEMERTGGEPDVIGYDEGKDEYIFCDCSEESPVGRRNLCYDQEALDSRKDNKPVDSAVNMAGDMGIEILSEGEYRRLQEIGSFDKKTSSWVKTPADIRELGGAVFCDFRYGNVFLYHNGASSYYGVRGFRGSLRV